MNSILRDRREAGQKLANKLTAYANHPQGIVLGLPRGGVPVAYEIAKCLNLPLDICLVRKLGLPHRPETAMGAIAQYATLDQDDDKIMIIGQNIAQIYGVDQEQIKEIAAREQTKLKHRDRCYGNFRPVLTITDHLVILVDDGMATGLTMLAAVAVIRQYQPAQIIVAVPVASLSLKEKFQTQVDDFVCLMTPKSLTAVSVWYQDFTQTTDQEVCQLLRSSGNLSVQIITNQDK